MKKLYLSLSLILLSLTFAACTTEEAPLSAGAQNGGSYSGVPDKAEANEPAADGTDAKISEANPSAEYPVEMPSEQEDAAADTIVFTSPDNTSNQGDDPANTTPANLNDPANTIPANLNDPIPTMTHTGFNAAGDHEFTIQNNTQYEWGYGLEPYFEKYNEEQGVWLPVEPIADVSYIEIYCMVQPGGSSTYYLPIEEYYGELSAGSYRAGLLMRNHETQTAEMIWCEFGVEVIECY